MAVRVHEKRGVQRPPLPAAAEVIARLEAEVERLRMRNAELESMLEKLRASRLHLEMELRLLKQRIIVAKKERVDVKQLELEFEKKSEQLRKLADRLATLEPESDADPTSGTESTSEGGAGSFQGEPTDGNAGGGGRPAKHRPKGRRDLSSLSLPIVREEVLSTEHEAMVAEGRATRIGFEESEQLGRVIGGMCRVVLAVAKYRIVTGDGESTLLTTPRPKALVRRSLLAPSLIAHFIVAKFAEGTPCYRLEERCEREGVPVNRGTMSRVFEEVGNAFGATICQAMHDDAIANAFCIATDSTGVLVQPDAGKKSEQRARGPCRRGKFTVALADLDHVIFRYGSEEKSHTVAELFHGFSGYVQADAASVHDVLFTDPKERTRDFEDDCVRTEVGCWSHARRKLWEAATLTSDAQAREALLSIAYFFQIDGKLRALPPAERLARRMELRPTIEAFFDDAAHTYEQIRRQRGPVNRAFGYLVRQRKALCTFLTDGRLHMDNNRSERELRRVAIGRKNWLFVGSDCHGEAVAGLFTLIASARLHSIEPERYLRELIRVLPHWPRGRFLELSPKYWARTRPRLDDNELAREHGPLTLPPPLDPLVLPRTTEE